MKEYVLFVEPRKLAHVSPWCSILGDIKDIQDIMREYTDTDIRKDYTSHGILVAQVNINKQLSTIVGRKSLYNNDNGIIIDAYPKLREFILLNPPEKNWAITDLRVSDEDGTYQIYSVTGDVALLNAKRTKFGKGKYETWYIRKNLWIPRSYENPQQARYPMSTLSRMASPKDIIYEM